MKMAVVARSEETANKILAEGKNVLLCTDNDVSLLDITSVKKIHLNIDDSDPFFSDFDVVQYIPSKGLYKKFNGNSDENVLILSEKCNSNCVMCPYSENFRINAKTVKTSEILSLIDYISVYPSHLTITGGEPTLIGDGIFEIMNLLNQKFPDTSYLFLTNGRIFSCTEYFEKFIKCLPNDICFAIPIYGNSPERHDAITRTQGSFTEAVQGIQNLMRNNIKTEIRIVVSKLNYTALTDIAVFITKYMPKAMVVNFVGLEMCGNACRNQDTVWIDYPQAFEAMEQAIDILYSACIDVGIYNFPLCAVKSKYRALCRKSISDYKIVYDDKCIECSLKEICGGMFKSSYLLKHPEVKPVSIYD